MNWPTAWIRMALSNATVRSVYEEMELFASTIMPSAKTISATTAMQKQHATTTSSTLQAPSSAPAMLASREAGCIAMMSTNANRASFAPPMPNAITRSGLFYARVTQGTRAMELTATAVSRACTRAALQTICAFRVPETPTKIEKPLLHANHARPIPCPMQQVSMRQTAFAILHSPVRVQHPPPGYRVLGSIDNFSTFAHTLMMS